MNRAERRNFPGKPFDGIASYRELLAADAARFLKAQHLIKKAFALYRGDDRCRLLSVLLAVVERGAARRHARKLEEAMKEAAT